MLPKKNRADKKAIIAIFKEGRYLTSPSLTFKYLKTSGKVAQISFIAPKSVAKLAVKRNNLRRKGYRALQKYIDIVPAGIVGAFVYKKIPSDTATLEDEIKNILAKIN